jgi:hypothetical protein
MRKIRESVRGIADEFDIVIDHLINQVLKVPFKISVIYFVYAITKFVIHRVKPLNAPMT